jgi:large subunit ribosomal protein L4
MQKVKVYNSTGKDVGEVALEPKIFNIKVVPTLIQQAVRTQLANKRIVLAHTKTRAEVRGGGKKPWKQKGTGRARHGSIRSPIWKGGGVTFGPRKDRNFSLKMNKKAKRQALFMTLSDKAEGKKVIVLDQLAMPVVKTKSFLSILSKLPIKGSILVILPKSDQKIIKSVRNLPFAKTISADSLNIYDVIGHEFLLLPKESLAVISKTFLK